MDWTNEDKAINWENGVGYGKVMKNTLTYKEFGDRQGYIDVEINNVIPKQIKCEFSDLRINSVQLISGEYVEPEIENNKGVYSYNVQGVTTTDEYLHKISFSIPYEAEFTVNQEKEYSAYVDISVTYDIGNTQNEIIEKRRVYYNIEELDMSQIHSRIRRQPGQAN